MVQYDITKYHMVLYKSVKQEQLSAMPAATAELRATCDITLLFYMYQMFNHAVPEQSYTSGHVNVNVLGIIQMVECSSKKHLYMRF